MGNESIEADYSNAGNMIAVEEELQLQAIESLTQNSRFGRQNLNALGMTDESVRNRKKCEEEIRRTYFSGNDEGFKKYLEDKVDLDLKTQDSIWQYEKAQLEHGLAESVENTRAVKNREYAESVITGIAANTTQCANVRSRITLKYNADIFEAKEKIARVNEEYKAGRLSPEEAAKQIEAIQESIKTANITRDAGLAGANSARSDYLAKQMDGLRNWYSDSHKKTYKSYRDLGYDHNTAYNLATQKVGSDAKTAISEMISAGCGDAAMFFVNTLSDVNVRRVQKIGEDGKPVFKKQVKTDEDGNVVVDKDGKPVYEDVKDYVDGKFDDSKALFMTRDDVQKLVKEMNTKIADSMKLRNAKAKEEKAFAKTQLKALVYSAQRFADEAYGKGLGVTEIEAKKNEFLTKINELYAGHPDIIGSEYNKVLNYYSVKQHERSRIVGKALDKKNQEEIDAELAKMMQSPTYDLEVPIIDENGRTTTKKVTMDSHKAIVTFIEQQQHAGFCIGSTYNDLKAKHEKAFVRAGEIQRVLNKYFYYGSNGILVGGDTKSRNSSQNAIIMCGTDGQGNATLENVSSRNIVYNDVNWGIDNPLDGDTLKLVVDELNKYYQKDLMPTEKELDEIVGNAVKSAREKEDRAAFAGNVLANVRQTLGLKFDADVDAATYGEARRKEALRVAEEQKKAWSIKPVVRDAMRKQSFLPEHLFDALNPEVKPLIKAQKYGIIEPDFQQIRGIARVSSQNIVKRIMQGTIDEPVLLPEDDDKNDEE